MSLLEVRKNFIQFSGRYDLIVDRIAYADKGANFFIRAGQDYLDRLVEISTAGARYFIDVQPNSWYVLVPRSRVIEAVTLSNTEGNKWNLSRVDLAYCKYCYIKDPLQRSGGPSRQYAIGILRTVPEVAGTITISKFGPTTYTTTGESFLYTGVLFTSPTDQVYSAEVIGKFYEPYLALDSDVNRWTEVYPFVLAMAACRALEISYRNTAGVKDWEYAIEAELHGVELDTADQESNFIREMRG